MIGTSREYGTVKHENEKQKEIESKGCRGGIQIDLMSHFTYWLLSSTRIFLVIFFPFVLCLSWSNLWPLGSKGPRLQTPLSFSHLYSSRVNSHMPQYPLLFYFDFLVHLMFLSLSWVVLVPWVTVSTRMFVLFSEEWTITYLIRSVFLVGWWPYSYTEWRRGFLYRLDHSLQTYWVDVSNL